MSSIYRLCSSRFAANNGVGAALHGGRWNGAGTEVIYASQSPSLAALEILVHFSVLPKDYALTEIVVPDALKFLAYEASELPAGWDAEVAIPATQEMGDAWVAEGRYAVLSVPSCIIPTDRNFVINPAHPAFASIEFKPASPFRFDPRLK